MLFRNVVVVGLCSGICFHASHGAARPCFPSDPTGDNPGNLCLIYPTHGMSLDSETFRDGFASEGFYGPRAGPRWPGTPLEDNHAPGTALDPNGQKANGYWTRLEASDGESRFVTNTGKEWKVKLRDK